LGVVVAEGVRGDEDDVVFGLLGGGVGGVVDGDDGIGRGRGLGLRAEGRGGTKEKCEERNCQEDGGREYFSFLQFSSGYSHGRGFRFPR
jgi:hypothetical protein